MGFTVAHFFVRFANELIYTLQVKIGISDEILVLCIDQERRFSGKIQKIRQLLRHIPTVLHRKGCINMPCRNHLFFFFLLVHIAVIFNSLSLYRSMPRQIIITVLRLTFFSFAFPFPYIIYVTSLPLVYNISCFYFFRSQVSKSSAFSVSMDEKFYL